MKKEEFDKLSKIDQRKHIARDVLVRLNNNFTAMTGRYILVPKQAHYSDWEAKEAQSFAQNDECAVCAKGAIVMSFIAMFNTFSGSDMRKIISSDNDNGDNDNVITEIFGKDLWDAVERAYEGWAYEGKDGYKSPVGKFVHVPQYHPTWKDGYKSPTARLTNIMQEIADTGTMDVYEPYIN